MPNAIYTPSFNAAMNHKAIDDLSPEMKAKALNDPDMMFQLEMMDLQHQQALQATIMQTLSAMQKKEDDTSAAIAQNFR